MSASMTGGNWKDDGRTRELEDEVNETDLQHLMKTVVVVEEAVMPSVPEQTSNLADLPVAAEEAEDRDANNAARQTPSPIF